MPNVLVVDDSPIDRQIAGSCLLQEGLRPVYAENGREALELIQREPPDFVLTDLQMPEIDGLELVEKVKDEFPGIPVILMTAHGSEDIAVAALRAGAASYVPKQNLCRRLREALHIVRDAVVANRGRQRVRHLLKQSEASFLLGYEPDAPQALVSFVQDELAQLNISDDNTLLQVSTALTEALRNAIDHGNLELDSELRDSEDNAYRELGDRRATEAPYRDRRVHFSTRLTPSEARYVVRDEGPGFDPSQLPDPTDPENLLRPSGRGIMLIRTFMDDVVFSSSGNELTMVKRLSD